MGLARRIGNLFRRSQVDREIDAEMEAHIALRTEENIARGMTPQEARRDARVRFGNPSVMKEKATGADAALGLENLWFDVRYALRQMRRAPGFAFTVILTLTLGIGATTAMFTLIDATLLRTLPYPEANRIVRIHDVRLQGHSTAGLVGVPRFFDLAERSKSFAEVAFFYFDDTTLIDGARLPVAIKGAGNERRFLEGLWRKAAAGARVRRTGQHAERADGSCLELWNMAADFWRRSRRHRTTGDD